MLHYICSKATGKATDGAWPIMILPAKHKANKISKQLFDEEDDISSDYVHTHRYICIYILYIYIYIDR